LPAAAEEKLLGDYAWFGTNAGSQTHPVGQKRANAWGLYDMNGNVWQWCRDWYHPGYYAISPANDPEAPTTGSSYSDRVNRGGSSFFAAWRCRSANRNGNDAEVRTGDLGFRVAQLPAD
jgi:formylglycine-generating enzyme required for sulfatase activity